MVEAPVIGDINTATRKDLLSRWDEIPETSKVEVKTLSVQGNGEEGESHRLLTVLEKLLEEIDPTQIVAATLPVSPYEIAVVDKYRRQGRQI